MIAYQRKLESAVKYADNHEITMELHIFKMSLLVASGCLTFTSLCDDTGNPPHAFIQEESFPARCETCTSKWDFVCDHNSAGRQLQSNLQLD